MLIYVYKRNSIREKQKNLTFIKINIIILLVKKKEKQMKRAKEIIQSEKEWKALPKAEKERVKKEVNKLMSEMDNCCESCGNCYVPVCLQ